MTPVRGERRRAHRGYTYDPCHGCGAIPDNNSRGRPKGSVCTDCYTLLNEAKDRRKFLAAQGKQKWFGHNRVTHWNPYFHVGTYYGHNNEPETRDLQQAFVDMIFAVALDERGVHEGHGRYLTGLDGRVVDELVDHERREACYCAVALTQQARDAISQLHSLIGRMLPAAYQAGEKHGRSVLFQLAAGEVSQSDFDGVKKR